MTKVRARVISRFQDRETGEYVDPQRNFIVLDEVDAARLEKAGCVVIKGTVSEGKGRKPRRAPKDKEAPGAEENKEASDTEED